MAKAVSNSSFDSTDKAKDKAKDQDDLNEPPRSIMPNRRQLTPGEYDQLFQSERLQVSRFKGLRTWEADLFAQIDPYNAFPDSQAWLDSWFSARQIKVREWQHLFIFRKDRWLDCPSPICLTMAKIQGQQVPRSVMWSVDHEPLWNELSVCIELADRILKHSFKSPWLVVFDGQGNTLLMAVGCRRWRRGKR